MSFLYIYPPRAVTVSVPPVGFDLDGAPQTVTQDTVTPANNKGLPTVPFYYDGTTQVPATFDPAGSTFQGVPVSVLFSVDDVPTSVNKDSGNPSNSRALPVEIINSPVRFNKDGNILDVYEDTVSPGSSAPLPVKSLDSSGNVISPLTNAQLRATPVPVSGPLTDDQLRASAVPVSASSLPLPTGAATESTLSAIDTKTPALVAGRVPVDGSGVTQPVSVSSLPLPSGAATESTLSAISGKLPATLGAKPAAQALAVTLSSDGAGVTALGTPSDAAVTNPASSASIVAALKGLLSLITSSNTKLDTLIDDGSPAFDTTQTQDIVGSVVTFTPPAGAKRMLIQNSLDATSPVRFVGNTQTPSATVGYYLGIGQSTSDIPAGIVKVARTDAGGTGNVSIAYFI